MMITKSALTRRTFLCGSGAVVALPLLDAMVPALTPIVKTAAAPVRRLGFVYVPNGTVPRMWKPAGSGRDFTWSPILAGLEPYRDRTVILSGLNHVEGDSKNDGSMPHQRASAVWLSGVHAELTRLNSEVRLAATADQLAARVLGKDTPLPSLELMLDGPGLLSCDAGQCIYESTISWRTPTTPLPMEMHPRVVFERLFGDGGDAAYRQKQLSKDGSILDSVVQQVARLQKTLGPRDRVKLTEYLEAVRDVEGRIQRTQRRNAESPLALPESPTDIPETFEEHAKLMFDLVTLAYQADVTRVFTMVLGREASARTFPHLGVPEQHHPISHHREEPELIAKKSKIDSFHVQLFSYFLSQLRASHDGDGTLLDQSMVVYGSAIGDGNLHSFTDIPTLVVGGGGGQMEGGRHLQYKDAPMTNLLLALLDKVGVPVESLGDSTGRLPLSPLAGV